MKSENSSPSNLNRPTIWVDADACPKSIKDFLFRMTRKRELKLVLVANQTMNAPASEWISVLTVPHGADKADDRILEQIKENDIVVTGDIPLAARVVAKGSIAIGVRGELFDESSIGQTLASRNLMDYLRSAGLETSGPPPFGAMDIQKFTNQLDRTVTRVLKKCTQPGSDMG